MATAVPIHLPAHLRLATSSSPLRTRRLPPLLVSNESSPSPVVRGGGAPLLCSHAAGTACETPRTSPPPLHSMRRHAGTAVYRQSN
ncbi:hypothetical protein E2562_020872 [Oryza meyeriana var. granulata]|uniref:Uncharacterized protein n=1 Tax=Oryza meyeriana var. granulata TaxID=110450 RepID=A0A6G1D4X2_9ORYZ|nr:hypothetical protein E2562_020872 [Oryza meyeriana var. granulata]